MSGGSLVKWTGTAGPMFFFLGFMWLCFDPAVRTAESEDGAALSPGEFLKRVRRPFVQEVWGTLSGEALHISEDRKKLESGLDMSILYTPEAITAAITLNGTDTYNILQKHAENSMAPAELTLPAKPNRPTLFDFGIQAEDITLSFVCWEFLKEEGRDSVGRQKCRVMILKHPSDPKVVRVWFSEEFYFPLQAHWFYSDEDEPWRRLEFKGFKQYEDDLWFVKTMYLRGAGWKTRLDFDNASFHSPESVPVPVDLFPEYGEVVRDETPEGPSSGEEDGTDTPAQNSGESTGP